jgi:hypothetical protein
MRIGIIGAGDIGGTAARLFAEAGHAVMVSNSRGPDSLREQAAELGVDVGTVDQAARFGEVVLLAVPWRAPDALPAPQAVAGKIVVDAMNPYGHDGRIIDLAPSTSSEETARRLPGARIVKAFNTIWSKHLAEQGSTALPLSERRAIFVAGDDAGAKAVVSRLIEEIGFVPVDTGALREGGRSQEPGTAVYNREIRGADAALLVAPTP